MPYTQARISLLIQDHNRVELVVIEEIHVLTFKLLLFIFWSMLSYVIFFENNRYFIFNYK